MALYDSSSTDPVATLPPKRPPRRPRRRNFVVRFWRGEIALGPSFWLVYLLLSAVVGKSIAAFEQRVLLGTSYDPKLLLAVVAGGLAASLPLTIWQFVGVWRSARARRIARRARGKRAIWPRLAQAVVVVGAGALATSLVRSTGPALFEVYRMAYLGDPGIPDYGFRTMRGGTEAEIGGGFKYGLTRDFVALLRANPNLRVVHLASIGGRIGEARHLYRAIREHGLETYVAGGCYSACTMAYAAGKRRWLGPHAVLGFHAPAFPGVSSGGTMATYEANIFKAAGFTPAFIAHAVSVIPPAIWKPSRDEMVAAHVVTDLAGPDLFADSGAGLDLSEVVFDGKVKLALPPLATLAKTRPDLFRPIAAAALKSYRDGGSALTVGHILGAGYQSAFKAMLPKSDDDTLIAYARLVVDEYGALKAKSTSDCYLYGSGQAPGRDFLAELGPAMAARDAALKARVVATRAPRDTLSAPEAQAVRTRFIAALAHAAPPSDLRSLSKSQTTPAGQAAYCRAIIATFKTAVELDPMSAGTVLSHMLGGG